MLFIAGGVLTIAGGLFAAGVFDGSVGDSPAVVFTEGGSSVPATLLNAPPAASLDPAATPVPETVSTELASPDASGSDGQTGPPAATSGGAGAGSQAASAANQPAATGNPQVVVVTQPPAVATDVPVAPTQAPPAATPVPPTPGPTQAPAPPPASLALHPMEQAMFTSHNGQRSGAGLAGLTLDARLVQVARQRAQDMATKNYFSHTSPTGETAFTNLDQIGYAYQLAGENIARNNYPDSQTVEISMTGFMNSPGHRANILEPVFRRVGIGIAFAADGMKYFAVVFSN